HRSHGLRLLLLVLALVAALGSSVAVHAEARRSLSLSPAAGPDGTAVSFNGDGYTAGAEVTVVAGEDGIILTTTQADASGKIAGELEMPPRADLTGISSNRVGVFAVEMGSGKESERVSYRYLAHSTETLLETVELSFELAVHGSQPAGSTYWALYGPPGSELSAHRMTDPEADGTYSFSSEVPSGTELTARMVRGTGTKDTDHGLFPGEPSVVLEDFGKVAVARDTQLTGEAAARATPAHERKGGGRDARATAPSALPNTGGGAWSRWMRLWWGCYRALAGYSPTRGGLGTAGT
ncbi:MAG: hypothetical protein M3281_06420, partial [Chloroflexota bacterium]|nr:hypothetical protein [Chloroflexota bacterium]